MNNHYWFGFLNCEVGFYFLISGEHFGISTFSAYFFGNGKGLLTESAFQS